MTTAPVIDAFDHVTLLVRDVEAATRSYEQLLGLPPTWRGEHAELGTSAALFGVGNALIELTGPRPNAVEAEGMRALLDARGEGSYALAFGTPDAATCWATLRERGLRAAPPAHGEAHAADGSRREFHVIELSPRATRGLSVLAVQRQDAAALKQRRREAPDSACALDHVVIRSADPDAALALYGQGLGLRLALDTTVHGARMLFFRVGGVTIEVVHDPQLGAQDAFHGLCYRVRDLDAAHARLRSRGLDVSDPRDGKKPGTRVFSVRSGTASVPTLILKDPSRAD